MKEVTRPLVYSAFYGLHNVKFSSGFLYSIAMESDEDKKIKNTSVCGL